MANKRVLIFSLAYYPMVGGAEVAVKELTDRLPEFEFDMLTLRFNETDKAEERVGNINVYRISGSKNMFPIKAFFLAWRLHKANRYRYAWAIMANWAGLAALFFKLKFPKVRYVLTLQEGDSLEYIHKKVRFIYPLFRKIFLKADTIQTISHFLADWARGMGYKGRVEVIPNGVDTKKFTTRKTKTFVDNITLITTSRLVEKNGIGDIVESLRYLPDNVNLSILGTGPLEDELRRQVEERGLETRVRFLGFVDQTLIPKYLHEAHIFVRPSLSEGMGISFIEAMSAGLPVIATNVGGIPDFLFDPDKTPQHPPTGLFVNVHDPKSIALQVERLLHNTNLRDTLVANAKRLVKEKYDWDLIAETLKNRVFEA